MLRVKSIGTKVQSTPGERSVVGASIASPGLWSK